MSFLTKRNLLILAGVLTAAGLAAAVWFSGSQETAEPAAEPTPSETPSPSPSPSVEIFDEDHGADGEAQSREFSERYPVMRHLPYQLPYWSLELASQDLQDGTIDLLATIYLTPGDDRESVIRKQRPYIDAWLKKVGQAPGTYKLEIQTINIDSY